MADVVPFKGIYYNARKVSGNQVVAPPYDIITEPMRRELYARSPYNIVRVDYGMESEGDSASINKYTRASAYIEQWMQDGVLIQSGRPAFYAYRMDYEAGGARRSLTGFFGLVRIRELCDGVYPHEATHSKPKLDRMALLEHTMANTSSIFSLYNKAGRGASEILGRAVSGPPALSCSETGNGQAHSLWPVDEARDVEALQRALSDSQIFIADGHHRYETALEYRRLMRQKEGNPAQDRPYDFVLMFLADIEDENLTALPTHRLVTGDVVGEMGRIGEFFNVLELSADADIIDSIKGRAGTVGLYSGGRRYVLEFRGGDLDDVHPSLRGLDVVVLDELLLRRLFGFEALSYEMDPAEAMKRVDGGEFTAAFFLRPTAVGDIEKVALSSQRMPPKSTYFYPKVKTGFVLYSMRH